MATLVESRRHTRPGAFSRRWAVAVVLAATLAAAACVTPIAQQRWVAVSTGGFDVMSSASPAQTAELVRELDLFLRLLEGLTGRPSLSPTVPARMYIFGDAPTFGRFRPLANVAGYAAAREDAFHIAMYAGDGERALEIIRHELVHFALGRASSVRYPRWYAEGLAELLSTLSTADGAITLGTPPVTRLPALSFGANLSAARLLSAEDVYGWSAPTLARFYAHAWALTHYLYLGRARTGTAQPADIIKYVTLVDRGADRESASRESFGLSVSELGSALAEYLGRRALPVARIPISSLTLRSAAKIPPLQALSPSEHMARLASLALALGPGPEALERAEALAQEALALDPEHAVARALLARTRIARGAEDASAELDRALAMRADGDATLLRLQGDALLDCARSLALADPRRPAAIEEARARYRASVDLLPGQAAAHAGLGRTYLIDIDAGAADLALGIEALSRARDAYPGGAAIAADLGQLHLRAGDAARARPLLEGALRRALGHSSSMPPESLTDLLRAADVERLIGAEDPSLEPTLTVAAPLEAATLRDVAPWAEVAGRAALEDIANLDLVIMFDVSGSTVLASGDDFDQDGRVGVSDSVLDGFRGDYRKLTTDPDDTVIEAERATIRTLLEAVDPATTRVGLAAFSGSTRVLAPLGAPADALYALERFPRELDATGTGLASALARGVRELSEGVVSGELRRRMIVVLCDADAAVPAFTSPVSGFDDGFARDVADTIRGSGVALHMLVIGGRSVTREGAYAEIAERAGGELVRIHRAGDALRVITPRSLPALDRVDIVSLTTQQPGRGVRTLPDGRFDGFVSLVPGTNEVEIRATLVDGTNMRAVRTLTYAPPADGQATAEQLTEARRVTGELEARASEAGLRRAAAQGAERAKMLRATAAIMVPAPAGVPLTQQEVLERGHAIDRALRTEDRSVELEAAPPPEPGSRKPTPAPDMRPPARADDTQPSAP
jgi:tetratricopeptide (TPR) repeat protein